MKRFLALVTLSVVLSITVSLLVAAAVKIGPHLGGADGEEPAPEA